MQVSWGTEEGGGDGEQGTGVKGNVMEVSYPNLDVVLEEVDLCHVVEGHNGAIAERANDGKKPEQRLWEGMRRRGEGRRQREVRGPGKRGDGGNVKVWDTSFCSTVLTSSWSAEHVSLGAHACFWCRRPPMPTHQSSLPPPGPHFRLSSLTHPKAHEMPKRLFPNLGPPCRHLRRLCRTIPVLRRRLLDLLIPARLSLLSLLLLELLAVLWIFLKGKARVTLWRSLCVL